MFSIAYFLLYIYFKAVWKEGFVLFRFLYTFILIWFDFFFFFWQRVHRWPFFIISFFFYFSYFYLQELLFVYVLEEETFFLLSFFPFFYHFPQKDLNKKENGENKSKEKEKIRENELNYLVS